jgi:putative hemolysin
LILLIILNAFFAASEIALVSLNDARIKALANQGHKKAQSVEKLLSNPSRFLATIQIGITLAGFLASAFASATFADQIVSWLNFLKVPLPEALLKSLAMVLITVVLAYFSLVLGELVPKRLAMKKPEPVAFFSVKALTALADITSPFVSLLTLSTNMVVRLCGFDPEEDNDDVTEEEIRLMVDIGEERGAIDRAEKLMINNIFEFNNKIVGSIMTHRTDISALPMEASLPEVISLVNEDKFSRIPVYKDSLDNIVGILYTKDLLQFLSDKSNGKEFSLPSLIRSPYFVPESKRTDELFRELQKAKIHIAVVIDEHGGTAGIITIEDLLEEIVGNIFDEYDEEEKEFSKLDDNTYLIKGTAGLDKVQDYLNVKLPIEEYETLSGFIIGQLGKIPDQKINPIIEYEDLVFRIEEVQDKRITLIKVCKA